MRLTSSWAREMRVRLVSWNVHGCVGTDRRFEPHRTADALARLCPDVALLQEVGDNRGVHPPVDQAATLDPVLAAVAIAASMLGTTLARRILEAMSDAQFRTWANRLITTVAGYYILYGGWLLFTRTSAMAF